MKRHLIVFLLSSMCAMAMAEDLIVFRSGEVIKGKFIDLGYKIHQWTVDTTPAYGELTVGYCFRHH